MNITLGAQQRSMKTFGLMLCLLATLMACKFEHKSNDDVNKDAEQATEPEEMQQAELGGFTLEYEVQGTGEPILFIHGSAIANTYSTLMPEPSLSNYQLIRYHRRGFAGSSSVESPFTIQDQATDAAALLQYLGIEKAHIVGHSYGASIALQMSVDFPSAVHSIVMMEPPGISIPADQSPPQGIIDGFGFYQAGDSEGAINAFLKWALGENWETEAEAIAPGGPAQAKSDAKTFFEVEVPALGQWQFGEGEAILITQPVLYLTGSLSISEMTVSKPYLASWIPQFEMYTVAGVNHSLHAKKPQEVAEVLSSFLQSKPIME